MSEGGVATGRNPLLALKDLGQSIWLDDIRRSLLVSGGLERLVRDDGLAGMTSNPTIFEQAIDGTSEYDEEIERLASAGASTEDILWDLIVADIRAAADTLRPVFDATGGADGFVSVELPPELAHDSERSVQEGRRLWSLIDRPNLMVKVPGTAAGARAVERLTAAGVNVNVTLLFSLGQYERVARAYLAGGGGTASVASFFLSRIDTAVDARLPAELRGRVAIANAKLAYRRFGELFAGAPRRQRLLWASTSTKNPAFSDVLYLEELIGPETVNTVPPKTLDAFRDHGRAARTLDAGVDDAARLIAALPEHGIDLDAVCRQLQDDGVAAFQASWDKLKATLARKRDQAAGDAALYPATLARLQAEDVGRRLAARDTSLWAGRGGDALGWLDVPRAMQSQVADLNGFAEDVRAGGYRNVFLLGMGGSSLCPDVLRRTFGSAPGYPALTVLDTSDPVTILSAARAVDLNRVLFVVASKSGTTLEPDCLYRFFWDKKPDGRQFVAITDPGTPLDHEATERGFRRVFRNPSDIGGRYSALSYFGLVPAALMGLDVGELLARATAVERDAGVRLGAELGGAWEAGRDKVTFLTAPGMEALPDWLEQLLAESTGKQGKGLVPVAGEPLGPEGAYGDDRLFVAFDMGGVAAATPGGQPVVRLRLRDRYDLAAQFYLWELATATAGHVLGIDAFDQPNVQEAKDRTSELLEAGVPPLELIDPSRPADLARFVGSGSPGDYVAFMAYLPYRDATLAAASELRRRVRDRTRLATTFGYGPRFLHSTGQLHKGGSERALFVQITADDAEDAAIPGRSFTFATVKRAQALGDYRALKSRGRRVMHLHLDHDGLEEVLVAWR